MRPKRILYVNGGIMAQGGIESFMMNYYRNIDRSKLQIDFIVHGFEKGYYDDEISELGGHIYRVPVKSKNFIGNILALKKIFRSNKYIIIHSHLDAMSTLVLKLAKQCGIPIRIAHSHNTKHLTNNRIKFFINELARKEIKKNATHLFACSDDAAKWLFGDKSFNNGEIKIISNAIELEKYSFNFNCRLKIRKEFNLGESLVIGHIGRFDYQKNHIFTLKVFKEIIKKVPNAKLLLVGEGHLKNEILFQIDKLKLNNYVILSGNRPDIPELLSSVDLLLLPSLFEGLGMVLIEAQANGLHCIASTKVPKQVNQTGLVKFLSLTESEEKWAKHALNISEKENKRLSNYQELTNSGYNIHNEAKKLENIYLSLINGETI